VNEAVFGDGEVEQEDTMAADGEVRPSQRRRRAMATVLVLVVLAAGAGAAWAEGAFRSHGTSGTGQGAAPPATQRVVREDLSSQVPMTATLGYAGSYTVQGQGGGTLTWLPAAGQVISQGHVLYRVDNGTPVVLLYGAVPAWRSLDEGLTGKDVTQLNHDLVSLGYADSSEISALGRDYFSWETAYGVRRMESAAGVSGPSGSLPLGSVVFEPNALLISSVPGRLGGPANGQVLAATSDQHVVTIPVSTSEESGVVVGDPVMVTLPNGASTPGKISSVGTMATGTSANATIQVTVALTNPSAAGTLDQAPVTVYVTVATASNVLVVPVGALVAQSSGRYSVEVVGAGNTRRLVPVTVGIFDDNSGMVQVTGALTPGEQVVVPAT
jgi:multidrug efflux pump subunit AcrA (membrane-fusion protein)